MTIAVASPFLRRAPSISLSTEVLGRKSGYAASMSGPTKCDIVDDQQLSSALHHFSLTDKTAAGTFSC